MGNRVRKSYVIVVLLLVLLVNSTIVKAQKDSNESVILTVLKDQKTKKFLVENQALLRTLKEQVEVIDYSLEPYMEYPFQILNTKNEMTGIFPQMIEFFEQLTEVTFQQMSETGTKEEMLTKLETGELKLLLGITMSNQIKGDLATKNKECKIVALEEEMFLDPFVLIGQVLEEDEVEDKKEEVYSQQTLPYYYWGCLEDQYSELVQSVLEDHTVTYNSIQELEEAYREGIIQGMLITQGMERNYTFQDKYEYTLIKDFSLEASKYYCTAKNDKVLNKLLPKMIQLYVSLYDEYFLDEIPVLEVSHQDREVWVIKYIPIIVIGISAVIILTGIGLVVKRHRENKKLLRLLKRIPSRTQKEQEVLFVLLKTSKIRSKQHFQVFGLEQKHPKKTMYMEDLTKRIGFDFNKHYAFLIKKQEKEFSTNFDLYIRGNIYNYEEVGINHEDVIVSKIYRKEI